MLWLESLPVPRRPQPIELVALRHPDEYPMNAGDIVSTAGLRVAPEDFGQAFVETQVAHSTALQSRIRDGERIYLVGPLARVHLNADRLLPDARRTYHRLADRLAAPDPAASVFARGIEVLQAIEEALHVIETWAPPARPVCDFEPRAGTGHGATEAPRGLLHIGLETDDDGLVRSLRIVPPTAQNQSQIERDLRRLVDTLLDQADDAIRRRCEAAIRDYDPCISCSTHFLELTLERRPSPCASR